MIRRPPRSTRTDTLFPYTTLFRSTRRCDVTTITCVDLFCGAGGLTHGFVLEGLPVVAGIDLDPACRFPYEANNQARFLERDIGKVTTSELKALDRKSTRLNSSH